MMRAQLGQWRKARQETFYSRCCISLASEPGESSLLVVMVLRGGGRRHVLPA